MDSEFGKRSFLLVHGAASGPWVFRDWPSVLCDGPAVQVLAVDLHSGLDVANASMSDYATVVVAHSRELARPLILIGWSMGGLVAMMAAADVRPDGLVLLEPSPPGEVAGFDDEVTPEPGLFDGERVYGRFPRGVSARRESTLARDERKRGISVPSLPCPTLVVSSSEFADERGKAISDYYDVDHVHFDELDHWGLVLDRRVPRGVLDWSRSAVGITAIGGAEDGHRKH